MTAFSAMALIGALALAPLRVAEPAPRTCDGRLPGSYVDALRALKSEVRAARKAERQRRKAARP